MHVDSMVTPRNIPLRSCWPGRVMKKTLEDVAEVASSRYPQVSPLSFRTCYKPISTTCCWVSTRRKHGSGNQEVEQGTPLSVGQFCDPLMVQCSSQNTGWDVTSVEIRSVTFSCSILLPLPPIQVPPLDTLSLSLSWESSLALLLGNPS